MKKIRPIGDRILVEVLPAQEVTVGGIIIPETAQERPQRGLVIATGKGRVDPDGVIVPLAIIDGDEILFGKYSGTEVSLGDETYTMLREDDILGVVE